MFQAQEPRKRNSNGRFSFEEPILLEQNDDDVSCSIGSCVKRSGQDEFGPFWANRGKKDPTYTRNKLFAEEPHWILVSREDQHENEPFYVARGKKNKNNPFSRVNPFWKTLFDENWSKRQNVLQNLADLPIFIEQDRKGRGKNAKNTDPQ
jgi:hypothetical protein